MEIQSIRVLYVDDYPLDRALVRDALVNDQGSILLEEAASEEEFLELIRKKEFDIVLSRF